MNSISKPPSRNLQSMTALHTQPVTIIANSVSMPTSLEKRKFDLYETVLYTESINSKNEVPDTQVGLPSVRVRKKHS